VAAVIQEKLVLRIELADDGHPLESRYCIDAASIECDRLIGAAGEFGPLRLAGVSAAPLPKPKPDEHGA
jgi:hypothetical protein